MTDAHTRAAIALQIKDSSNLICDYINLSPGRDAASKSTRTLHPTRGQSEGCAHNRTSSHDAKFRDNLHL